MAKQSTTLLLTLAIQGFVARLSAAHPIASPSTEPYERDIQARGFNGACDYPCAGTFGAYGYPCNSGYNCAGGFPCNGFSASYYGCDGFGACGFHCASGDCGLPCGGFGGACGCLKKRGLSEQKRSGGIPYAGYGYPFPGYGACGYGACAPCVTSSTTACNSADQCCHNVAYENCEHVAASVCKDCDTAYCANKDKCCDAQTANCFSSVL